MGPACEEGRHHGPFQAAAASSRKLRREQSQNPCYSNAERREGSQTTSVDRAVTFAGSILLQWCLVNRPPSAASVLGSNRNRSKESTCFWDHGPWALDFLTKACLILQRLLLSRVTQCDTDQPNLSLNTLLAGAHETHWNLGSEPHPKNKSCKGKCA